MAVKIYALVWLIGMIAVALTYVSGYFTPTVAVAFGFLSFGAIFMGIMGVLPITVGYEVHGKH